MNKEFLESMWKLITQSQHRKYKFKGQAGSIDVPES